MTSPPPKPPHPLSSSLLTGRANTLIMKVMNQVWGLRRRRRFWSRRRTGLGRIWLSFEESFYETLYKEISRDLATSPPPIRLHGGIHAIFGGKFKLVWLIFYGTMFLVYLRPSLRGRRCAFMLPFLSLYVAAGSTDTSNKNVKSGLDLSQIKRNNFFFPIFLVWLLQCPCLVPFRGIFWAD